MRTFYFAFGLASLLVGLGYGAGNLIHADQITDYRGMINVIFYMLLIQGGGCFVLTIRLTRLTQENFGGYAKALPAVSLLCTLALLVIACDVYHLGRVSDVNVQLELIITGWSVIALIGLGFFGYSFSIPLYAPENPKIISHT